MKLGRKEADLDGVVQWSTEYHRKGGLGAVRYFLSEGKSRFVMIVEYSDRGQLVALRTKWEASGTERTESFRSTMAAVFEGGSSATYVELSKDRGSGPGRCEAARCEDGSLGEEEEPQPPGRSRISRRRSSACLLSG
jgi:hypothetical protein